MREEEEREDRGLSRREERGRNRGEVEEQEEQEASLQAQAQGGSEQKCGNAKCIMCTTLDRFGCPSAWLGKDEDFGKERSSSYTLAGDRGGKSSRSGEGRRLERR